MSFVLNGSSSAQISKSPPKTRTDIVKENLHGVEIVDPYRWLEDQKSPETRSWLNAQIEHTQAVLNSLPGREQLKQRLTELMKVDTLSPPLVRNGRYFFYKRLAGQDQQAIFMRRGLEGRDEVLVDPNSSGTDRNTSVSMLEISKDGTLLVYGVRQGGEDELIVNVLNVDTGKNLADRLPRGIYYGIFLNPDKSGIYYSRHGEEGSRIYYHALGSDSARDQEIFGKGFGPDKGIGIELSEDGRYLICTVYHGAGASRTEIYFKDMSQQGSFIPLVNDINARFEAQIAGNNIFILTNWEAPNGRILDVDLTKPERGNWREVIRTGKTVIDGFSLGGGKLFVSYLENVTSSVKIFDPSGKHTGDIAFATLGSISSLSGRWSNNEVFFIFNSFHIPTTIYRYDIEKASQDIWARIKVPVNSNEFEVKQIWYESKDKTRIPMFLMHGKGIKLDGSNPTLLYGYGGFNISLMPQFSPQALAWVKSGGVFAVANLRGGGEFGEEWHRAGMLEKKQNVFDDFISAAEWLIKNGYTKPSKLAITGTSNGGLLVGAALTQRPDLFQAVICGFPLLDMVRYHKFLLAKFWIPEYGSSEDPAQFKTLYSYSPYHQVKKGTKYPAVLFVTGDSDTRVDPLHARKMAALLQSTTGSDRPILLHYDTKAGHVGGLPVSKQIEDLTDELSFLFWQLGGK
jgi:prolyl oligopeptidase